MVKLILLSLMVITIVSFVIGLVVTVHEDKNRKNTNIVFTMDRDYSKVYGHIGKNINIITSVDNSVFIDNNVAIPVVNEVKIVEELNPTNDIEVL